MINLAKNLLTFIPNDVFKNWNDLSFFDLSYNDLEFIPETIGILEFLEELYLESNHLKCLPETIKTLSHLEKVCIFNNADLDPNYYFYISTSDKFVIDKFPENITNLHSSGSVWINQGIHTLLRSYNDSFIRKTNTVNDEGNEVDKYEVSEKGFTDTEESLEFDINKCKQLNCEHCGILKLKDHNYNFEIWADRLDLQ